MISVLTPTKNRAAHWPLAIECMKRQTFPGKIEWVIVEDGEADIRSLLTDLPENVTINYTRLDGQNAVGKKRNACIDAATSPVMVFWDDDDFYHPDYLMETYTVLAGQTQYGVIGSPVVLVYQASTGIFYSKGKQGNHSSCGVLGFTRGAMKQYKMRFSDYDSHAEEVKFLRDFRIPLFHRDPLKSIVAIQHGNNTWNIQFHESEKLEGFAFPEWVTQLLLPCNQTSQ